MTGVPTSVRRLWSLLYRATRRHAVRVDALGRIVFALAGRVTTTSNDLDELRGRVDALERERHQTGDTTR
jgi:hypothetical protein